MKNGADLRVVHNGPLGAMPIPTARHMTTHSALLNTSLVATGKAILPYADRLGRTCETPI
jgi:hypothetical protein